MATCSLAATEGAAKVLALHGYGCQPALPRRGGLRHLLRAASAALARLQPGASG